MQGKDFVLCKHERAIAKKAMNIAHRYSKEKGLDEQAKTQKAMEIFHLLVFLKTVAYVPRFTQISPHEPLDAIVKFRTLFNKDAFWRGHIGFEITTCFGAEKDTSGKQISPGGHPAIDGIVQNLIKNNNNNTMSSPELPNTEPFRSQFTSKITDKQSKCYDGARIDKKVLLIVTREPADAWCPVTGNWHEKNLKYNELGIDKTKFDRICVLNYFSSGKDNGPTAILNLAEEQKFYDSLFH